MPHDWHQFHASEQVAPSVVDSRRRLRICLIGFVLLLLVVFGRVVQLEVTQGVAFREVTAKPIRRERSLPGVRGRILAQDGTVLASDKEVPALAVRYRLLEEPVDEQWLWRNVRARLTRSQRKNPASVAAEQAKVMDERAELVRRLQRLCGISADEWRRRARRVQTRVERIAESVRRRRQADITVAEELDFHVMAEDLPLAVVAELERREQYSGITIVSRSRRDYAHGSLAAHVLGHLGPVEPEEMEGQNAYHGDDFVGRTGVERQYEAILRGRRGVAVELTDRGGQVVSSHHAREPSVGRDLVLTIDTQLQRSAETLLDAALASREVRTGRTHPAGGAVVVMDVHTGAIRAAASAPRFDPKVFVAGGAAERAAVLDAPDHPLFDRASRMAIPPGSVFKTVSAVALLESHAVDPEEPFFCRGYLQEPNQLRCAIYRRTGAGHGNVALADALCVSCNVYFFHHGGRMGAEPLVDWAGEFGFGRPTGIDLPGEAAGNVPQTEGDVRQLAIGQGTLTATPLQIVRMMAAVANGGKLVTPHVVGRLGLRLEAGLSGSAASTGSVGSVGSVGNELPTPSEEIDIPPPRPIPGLRPDTLAAVRRGLRRVVADPAGTAYGTLHLESVAVAGKTGTAQTGADRADHAWFAGYVPADHPKLALVVVLEHSGDGATAAAPVARRLVMRMQQLEML